MTESDDDIAPALTPEEWDGTSLEAPTTTAGDNGEGYFILASGKAREPRLLKDDGGEDLLFVPCDYARQADGSWSTVPSHDETDRSRLITGGKERHALAALALHGQPYGFTRDDVRSLRAAAEMLGGVSERSLLSVASRVAALLPPQDTK